jgi:hypothetical protein
VSLSRHLHDEASRQQTASTLAHHVLLSAHPKTCSHLRMSNVNTTYQISTKLCYLLYYADELLVESAIRAASSKPVGPSLRNAVRAINLALVKPDTTINPKTLHILVREYLRALRSAEGDKRDVADLFVVTKEWHRLVKTVTALGSSFRVEALEALAGLIANLDETHDRIDFNEPQLIDNIIELDAAVALFLKLRSELPESVKARLKNETIRVYQAKIANLLRTEGDQQISPEAFDVGYRDWLTMLDLCRAPNSSLINAAKNSRSVDRKWNAAIEIGLALASALAEISPNSNDLIHLSKALLDLIDEHRKELLRSTLVCRWRTELAGILVDQSHTLLTPRSICAILDSLKSQLSSDLLALEEALRDEDLVNLICTIVEIEIFFADRSNDPTSYNDDLIRSAVSKVNDRHSEISTNLRARVLKLAARLSEDTDTNQ